MAYVEDSFHLDATAPADLSGLVVENDNGIEVDDDLTNDTSLTAPAGEGIDQGGQAGTSPTTCYALTDEGAGTTGWVADPTTLGFDGTGQTRGIEHGLLQADRRRG